MLNAHTVHVKFVRLATDRGMIDNNARSLSIVLFVLYYFGLHKYGAHNVQDQT